MYGISSFGHPTRGDTLVWGLEEGLKLLTVKENLISWSRSSLLLVSRDSELVKYTVQRQNLLFKIQFNVVSPYIALTLLNIVFS
jgi:hypothetical protein